MKKLSLLTFLFFASSAFSFAEENKTVIPKILSETVKIISYNLTNNNHILGKSYASATIISSNGLMLTNNHVVTDENDEPYETFGICIVVNEKEKPDCLFTASLIAKDKGLDIALIQMDPFDIYGKPIPEFPFLEYEMSTLPPVEEKISLIGFPGVGGETMTITEGQISGYDEKEGFQQIKTDAVISPGNSGGTAKDSNGKFIGVPSYLRSYFGTIGYVVPLAEILPWLQDHIDDSVQEHLFAIELLRNHQQVTHEAEQKKAFQSQIFPFYTIKFPDPWKLSFVNHTDVVLENTVEGFSINLNISSSPLPYTANEDLLSFILKKIEKNQHNFTNYHREKYTFSDKEGYLITYDSGESRTYYFLAPIENTLFSYSYSISLENIEKTHTVIQKILKTFSFLDTPNPTPFGLQSYTQEYPNVSFYVPNPFMISQVFDSQFEDRIIAIENPNSFEQEFEVSRKYFPKDYWELSREEIFEKELKYIGPRLLNQYENVVIDGLSGYAYTISYKGDDFEQTRKKTTVHVFQDNKRYFHFIYDDLQEEYDKNIGAFREVLENFQFNGEENAERKGEYIVPTFRMQYEDTKYHLYEQQINALASKNILVFKSRNFFPEIRISRLSALTSIFEGKKFVEEGRNLSTTESGIHSAEEKQIFDDINNLSVKKMLSYAVGKKILSKKTSFHPKQGMTLAEALTILCRVYELPVWNPPYTDQVEWYVPYVYRGQLLGVIPEGLEHDSILNRGQFASLLYNFIRIVGERGDL